MSGNYIGNYEIVKNYPICSPVELDRQRDAWSHRQFHPQANYTKTRLRL